MTHYEQLEVSDRASVEVIHAAWKALMRVYHTDGSRPDEVRARAINAAHDILSEPEARAKYDLTLRTRDTRQSRPEQYRESEQPSSPDWSGWANDAHTHCGWARQQQEANGFGHPYPNAYPDAPHPVEEIIFTMAGSFAEQLYSQLPPNLRIIIQELQRARVQNFSTGMFTGSHR